MTLTRLATVTASTKRRPAISSGKIGTPATSVSSLKIVPLQPVQAEIATRIGLNTPHEKMQTFTDGAPDIKEGDILTISSKDYPIIAVENWSNASTGKGAHLLLIVEELKK